MSLALPIGVVPRLLQEKELDSTEHKLEAKKPVVSVSAVEAAPASRTINLPGTVEAILETPVYARTNGYVKARLADIGDRVSAGALLATIETPEVENSLEEADAQILVTKANEAQSRANQERARADLNRVIAELSQAKASLIEREADENWPHRHLPDGSNWVMTEPFRCKK
jgi:Membrane-fusion protein